MKKTVPNAAVKALAASVLALACAPALVACGSADAPQPTAKYSDIVGFLNADGPAQLAELKSEGFGYFDQTGAWSWGGTPEDNVADGPAWLILHKAETDEDGWDLMTKSDVENNVEIDWADMSWSELTYDKDELPAKVAEIADACGLSDKAGEGWSLGDTSYIMIGSCQLEGQDAYWTIEATPSAGEVDGQQTATLRIAVYQLNDAELDDVVAGLIPTEDDRDQYEQMIADSEAAAGEEAGDGAASPVPAAEGDGVQAATPAE